MADRLCADGLIRFRPHPTDRRTRLAEVTEHGRAVLAELTMRQARWINQLAGDLQKAELATVVRVLDALVERLEEEQQ